MQWLPRNVLRSVTDRISALPWLRGNGPRLAKAVHHVVVAFVIGVCVYIFERKVTPSYPITKWLFWVYARLWAFCALFAVACISAGHAAIGLLLPRGLSLRARAVYTLPAGVLVFFFGMFAGGLLHLYGPTFALAWPVAMALAGAPTLWRRLRRVVPRIRRARRRVHTRAPWWMLPVVCFGVVAVVAVYLQILTPGNIAFDSHFYHLGIAQQYAADGGISRSPEGWLSATIPHLASVLYTWALIAPGVPLVERVLLAGHMEFVLFLGTLASLPALVRWLVPGARAGGAWAAIFLFPGIFLYDSSLTTAADHIAAFFAPACYLAFAQAFRELAPRRMALFAAILGGALLTKYQSIELALLPCLAISFRALQLAIMWLKSPQHLLAITRGLGAAVLAGLVVTAPHWLKNWVWYGDPLYPYLHEHLTLRPFSDDAATTFTEYWEKVQVGGWRPKGTTAAKLKETFEALYGFSFVPHDWGKFHGAVPVFGSLFTLGTLILTTLRRTARLWGLYLAVNFAVLEWFWSMHQDRYLQVVVPWMAAAVAGTIALVWRLGWLPRIAILLLVAFQLVWGGDVYFIPTHSMLGTTPIKATADLLAQGYKKKYENRLLLSGELPKVAAALPKNARVLLHEENRRLGLDRVVVSDFTPWQYGIRWGRLESVAAMDQKLRDLGVTHLLWRAGHSRGFDSLAGDLRFFQYATNYAGKPGRVGTWSYATLAQGGAFPDDEEDVVYLGCGKYYERGVHKLSTLSVYEQWPPPKAKPIPALTKATDEPVADLIKDAEFVVVGKTCKPAVPKGVLDGLVLVATRGNEQLYVRKRAQSATSAPELPPGTVDDIDTLP